MRFHIDKVEIDMAVEFLIMTNSLVRLLYYMTNLKVNKILINLTSFVVHIESKK